MPMSSPSGNLPLSNLVETSSTSAPWYDPEPRRRLDHGTLSFFDSYCGLSGDALTHHLHTMHSRAWQIRPYPCIGQWGFLQPLITKSPAYQTVVRRLQENETLLDLGCCLGHDLRRLAADGAPTENMYGSDVEPAFWELGYLLYCDRDKIKAKFVGADIFDTASSLSQLNGLCDMIYLGALLHLWDWQSQAAALRTIFKLTKPGSLVIGIQKGDVRGTEVTTGWKSGGKTYFHHDSATLEKLWHEASIQTDTRWEITARLIDLKVLQPEERDTAWALPETRGLTFEAKRTR